MMAHYLSFNVHFFHSHTSLTIMHKHLLPPEILSLILENLSQADLFICTIVNHTFNVASTSILWRTPELRNASCLQRFAACLKRAKEAKGKLVRVLELQQSISAFVNDDWLSDVIIWMPLLDTLCIPYCLHLTDKSLVKLARYCKELTYLDLECSRITYRTSHHLRFCQNLRYLNLRANLDLIEFALLPFAHGRIEQLNLSDCPWVSATQTAQDICALQHLERLELINCRDVDDEFLLKISIPDTEMDSCNPIPELRTFALSSSRSVTDEGVMAFVHSHPKLENLTLYQSSLTDRSINEIRVSLPNLRFLDLSYCGNITGKAIRRLVADNDKLIMIGLKGCTKIKSIDFHEVANSDIYSGVDRLDYEDMASIRLGEWARLSKDRERETSCVEGQ